MVDDNERYNFIKGGLVPASKEPKCKITHEISGAKFLPENWSGKNISTNMLLTLERIAVSIEDFEWAKKIREEINTR